MDELCPRYPAGADICRDNAAQRPPLEVTPAKADVQTQRAAGGYHSLSQFDIFDRRSTEALVEASYRSECVGTERAQSCPECGRVRITGFMHIGVRKVLVLGHEIALRRRVVVGPEYAVEIAPD